VPPTPGGSGGGRRAIRERRDKRLHPVSVKALALQLPIDAWEQIRWREGSNPVLASRFARLRVRPAHRDPKRHQPAAEEWLLIEWPDGAAEPDHHWLSTPPADITFERLVDLTKLRWRIERDYLDLKQEVGLDHYEGRGWRGFHHHASLCGRIPVFETVTIPPPDFSRLARPAICRSRRVCRTPSQFSASASHGPWCAHCHDPLPYPAGNSRTSLDARP
jgi:SRSO17 transposase